jgi:hypothetical protein
MPDNIDNTGPARKPARFLIPPFKTIIEEGNQEIMRQANALVEHTLDSATAVDPNTLRKLGDDGTRYFFKRLKARINEKVGAAAAARAVPSAAKVAKPAEIHALSARATAILTTVRTAIKSPWKVVNANSAGAPVVAVKNWKAQQRYRSSYVTAAILRGLLMALIMIISAIIVLRLLA